MAGTDYRGSKQGQTVPPRDYASSYQHSSASQVPMPPDAYSAAYQALHINLMARPITPPQAKVTAL